MTVKEIHDQELMNCDRLYFRKEGIFWKAFDRSAFLLHLLGFDYKVSWSSYKALPDGVVRVGTSVHPKELLPDKKVLVDEDKYVVLEAGITLVEANYYEWREKAIEGTTSLVFSEAPQRDPSVPGTWSDGIIDKTKTAGTFMGFMKAYPDRLSSSMFCGSSFASFTKNEDGSVKNIQFYGLMPMTNKASEDQHTCNGTKVSFLIGAPLRCVRDQENQ